MADTLTFAAPGSLDTPTGGFVYDRRIVAGLRSRGWTVGVIDVGEGFPFPDAPRRRSAASVLIEAGGEHPIVVDGLALGALPEASAAVSRRRPLVGLVHHPLFLENGHSAAQRDALFQSERQALAHAARVITTSRQTGECVATAFDYPGRRISWVEPGFDRPPQPAPFRPGPDLAILCVGALVPRKGHLALIDALAPLRSLPWTLRIVGAEDRDPAYAERLRRRIDGHGLGGRILLTGAVADDELQRLYQASDVFALASEFEGYGMAFAEAVLHGLPVVGTTGGAIPATVPEGAGLLVPPADHAALREAMQTVLSDHGLRRRLSRQARRSRSRFPSWDQAAERFAAVLGDL